MSQRLSAASFTSRVHSRTRLRRRACWDTGGPSMTNSKGIGIPVGFSLRLVRVSVPYYPPAIVSFNPQGCAPVSRCAPHRCRSRAASASTGTALSAPATSANASWRTRAASASCARLTRRFGRGDAPVLAAPLPHAVTRRRARPCNWPAATPAWRWLRRPRSWTRWRCRSLTRWAPCTMRSQMRPAARGGGALSVGRFECSGKQLSAVW